jgi:demethylmenaquinone methyltransferase / 2-methoxy-6-polyprenyl-1,4-benzoquinol methylase
MPASEDIRRMFGAIAWRYDMLNRVLSLGTDRAWRRRTCDLLAVSPGEVAADLCCGTGDLALELAGRGAQVVGVDFSPQMLRLASGKGLRRLAEADCLRLPFPDGCLDLATVAFGVRNLADLEAGLREIRRVLRPGGRAGILEFARPSGRVFPHIYRGYLRWVLPAVGAAVSRRREAYRYLGTSIQAFPDQPRMKDILRGAGFDRVSHTDFARGIAALYVAHRPG